MATNQYIGARYVPKFANPVEWSSGRAYENLTIVTYLGNSYTSKIPVPSTVGNPADNPTYWAATGIYNQQVQQYIDEVEALGDTVEAQGDDIETLQSTVAFQGFPRNAFKNAVSLGFGDSNMRGDTPQGNMYHEICTMLGCTENNKGINGATYQTVTNYTRIINQINAESDVTPTDVKLIIFIGGINDFHYADWNLTNYGDAFAETITAAINKYPNAIIMCAFDGGSQLPNRRLLSMQWYTARRCGYLSHSRPVLFCSLADFCLASELWYNQNHYSATGARLGAARMVNYLYGFGLAGATFYKTIHETVDSPIDGTAGIYGFSYDHTTTINPFTFIREDKTDLFTSDRNLLQGPENVSSYAELVYVPGEVYRGLRTPYYLFGINDNTGFENTNGSAVLMGSTANKTGHNTTDTTSPTIALRLQSGTLAAYNAGMLTYQFTNKIIPGTDA